MWVEIISTQTHTKAIVEDILNLAKSFVNVNFSFVYREGNMSAHLLAQWAAILLWTRLVPISSLLPRITQGTEC